MNDLIKRQAAIYALTNFITPHDNGDGTMTVGVLSKSSITDILNDLPSAQPENADCIYCHEDSDGYVKPIEKNCHAFIRFGMDGWELDLKANGWHGSTKIRFCPMCGRELWHG